MLIVAKVCIVAGFAMVVVVAVMFARDLLRGEDAE